MGSDWSVCFARGVCPARHTQPLTAGRGSPHAGLARHGARIGGRGREGTGQDDDPEQGDEKLWLWSWPVPVRGSSLVVVVVVVGMWKMDSRKKQLHQFKHFCKTYTDITLRSEETMFAPKHTQTQTQT